MTDSTHPGAGNQAKYQSWRLAHERMQTAIAAGFPLEAVAIAESLVTDRLLSFVNFYGAGFNADKTTLHPVAEKAARICQEATHDAQGKALALRAQAWAKDRNAVLHAIAKSAQGTGPQIAADAFVVHAQAVAQRGLVLVKDIKAWHGQQVRASRNAGADSQVGKGLGAL